MPLSNHLGQPLPTSRRGILRGAAATPLLLLPHAPRVHASALTAKPVLDQPMRRQAASTNLAMLAPWHRLPPRPWCAMHVLHV